MSKEPWGPVIPPTYEPADSHVPQRVEPTDNDLRIAAELFGFDGAGNRTRAPSREAIARALAEREAAVTEPLRAVLQEKDRIADLRTKGIQDRDATIAKLTRERDEAARQEQRRCLDLAHSYYVTGLTEEQMRAVDRTVINIREAIRAGGERIPAIAIHDEPHRPTDATDRKPKL